MSPTNSEILNAALAIIAQHNSLQLATTGGPHTPWVAGVYFAEYPGDGLSLGFFLEQSGKSLANVRADSRVAFSISANDAQADFLQGSGRIELLPEADERLVRGWLTAKMPWYQTYTPVCPVRLKVEALYVSSFSRGWFPAKKLEGDAVRVPSALAAAHALT